MIIKIAEALNLSFEIPDSERKIAISIVKRLSVLLNKIDVLNIYLGNMYDPFKKYDIVSSESIMKYRSAIWTFSKKIEFKFKELESIAALIIRDISMFDSDSEITELKSSFTDDVGDIEKEKENLIKTLTNWDAKDYKDTVVIAMENLKKQMAQLRKLIEERIIEHLNVNIIAENWTNSLDPEISSVISKREPLLIQLFKERNEKLK
jgi:hypothetical protein